jgi:bifunctional enzyme CysN/CysC
MTALTALKEPVSAAAPEAHPVLGHELNGLLNVLTCGSVDDGKSTLIGRVLWDVADLPEDTRANIQRSRTSSGHPDFSLLLDGLVAEREQGITIDIAWRYFDTKSRRIVIIDSPGHEQYTRNMASGASHADVAIMLIDARHGIKRQTKRHAAILDLMGVKRVILAVNKMDLVDWSEDKFRRIEADFRTLMWRFAFWEAIAIPASAVGGDNIAARSANMPWYHGPTLVEHLDEIPSRGIAATGHFRFPVQTALRDAASDFRGLAGTVASGSVEVGDRITDTVSGKTARVQRISTFDGDLPKALQGQAVAIQLDTDLDIARGAVMAKPDHLPVVTRTLDARLVWLSEDEYQPRKSYLLRTTTDLVPISALEIRSLLDLETLAAHPATNCGVNDIAIAHIALGRATALDAFSDLPHTGTFMIVDAVSGASVAGGIVSAASSTAAAIDRSNTFLLTRTMLERGLCADLGSDAKSQAEFNRRANEAALLLRAAGVAVEFEVDDPGI